MRQIIKTKFLGATNNRGSRVKAISSAGSVTLEWNHAVNATDNHINAIRALHTKLGWDQSNDLVFGWDENSLVAVQVTKSESK